MKPAATNNPSVIDQYQVLLQLQKQQLWDEIVARSDALLKTALQPQQRALILQAQAEAYFSAGHHHKAAWVIEQSLQWMWMPDLALRWIEIKLPEWVWRDTTQQEDPWTPAWVPVCQQLVRAGHGQVLISALFGVLRELPLEGQRHALLEALERWQALPLEEHPPLKRQWRWLRRLALGS